MQSITLQPRLFFLIVPEKTGIKISVQCGGIECLQKMVEGSALAVLFCGDLDQCSFGCADIHNEQERQKKLAEAFDEYAKVEKDGTLKISFDYERIQETAEGWIPVILNGVHIATGRKFKNKPAYFHAGNCD